MALKTLCADERKEKNLHLQKLRKGKLLVPDHTAYVRGRIRIATDTSTAGDHGRHSHDPDPHCPSLPRERPSGLWEAKAPQDSSDKASFPFESASSSTARRHQCVYRSRKDRRVQGALPLSPAGLARAPWRQPDRWNVQDTLLSAQPGPPAPWGENTTLQCGSEVCSDPLHLSKEGSLAPPQILRLQDTAPPSQNNFTLSPVTSAHSGTYTCYSSLTPPPPDVTAQRPLELLISGLKWYLNVLIGVSVASVLLFLVLLFLLVRHRGQGRRRKSGE
eukprot:XP_028334086.1 LOW QUALITY PROTEIN: leukocyte immunoglobulin-like receptor subfamily B member 3 [Physeter catodon]